MNHHEVIYFDLHKDVGALWIAACFVLGLVIWVLVEPLLRRRQIVSDGTQSYEPAGSLWLLFKWIALIGVVGIVSAFAQGAFPSAVVSTRFCGIVAPTLLILSGGIAWRRKHQGRQAAQKSKYLGCLPNAMDDAHLDQYLVSLEIEVTGADPVRLLPHHLAKLELLASANSPYALRARRLLSLLNATREQKGREEAYLSTLATSKAISLFGQSYKRVRFATRDAAIDGFDVLLASGSSVETLGNNTFGLTSEEQLRLLNERGVPYEVVD